MIFILYPALVTCLQESKWVFTFCQICRVLGVSKGGVHRAPWALTSLLPYSAVLCSAFQRQKPVLPVMWLGLHAPENGSLEGLW